MTSNQEVVPYIKNNPLDSFAEIAYYNDCSIEDVQQALEDENTSHKELKDQDPKYAQRVVSNLQRLTKEFKETYESHYEEVGKYDEGTIDYLHKLERVQMGTEEEREVTADLIEKRKRRRVIKNQLWVGKPLYEFLEEEALVDFLHEISRKTTQKLEKFEDYTYYPRVYRDLFN